MKELMKKPLCWIIGGLSAISIFLFGFLIRQPQINKLRKQVELLHKDNSRLLKLCKTLQNDYRELFIQHKSLKVYQLMKKNASMEKLKENLIMQYALNSYMELLRKRVKYEQELTKSEIVFFNAIENFIDGKKLSTGDKIKIRDFILGRYSDEINSLRECDYKAILQELDNYS